MSEQKLRTYQGAVVVITGGASGIGRALGEELARRGAEVILADLQIDLAEEAADRIRSAGGKARATSLDVRDFAAVQSLIDDVVRTSGRVDYFFNNAGIVVGGEAHLYEIDDWNRVIDVNLRGVVNGVQAVYPIMRRQGFGHIVNTASIAGLVPIAGLLSYTTTKHAVVGLSTSLRVEAETFGVRVSVLCPGAVETAIVGGGKYGKVLDAPPPQIQRQMWEEGRPITAERFAEQAANAVGRNRAIIVIPWWWKLYWWINRLSPTMCLFLARRHLLSRRRIIEKSKEKS